jgi:hypothetical protein
MKHAEPRDNSGIKGLSTCIANPFAQEGIVPADKTVYEWSNVT